MILVGVRFRTHVSICTPTLTLPPNRTHTRVQDSFYPTVTVLEAVLFHAHMRLGVDVPLAAKLGRAREVIGLAGLQGKEDERVGGRLPGGIMVRGLSGGEKRRLSLCCGIVEGPQVLFCDEPTSGGYDGVGVPFTVSRHGNGSLRTLMDLDCNTTPQCNRAGQPGGA